ncbi:MAG: hypothetical protein JF607_07630, partial [Burkholderiales bacterium]|nr:hypothetical protein [Burkholderiales bacterium]
AETEKPDYDYARGTVLRVFELDDGASAGFTVVGLDGQVAARGTVGRAGAQYTARITEGTLRDWGLEVEGKRSPMLAEGATLSWSA